MKDPLVTTLKTVIFFCHEKASSALIAFFLWFGSNKVRPFLSFLSSLGLKVFNKVKCATHSDPKVRPKLRFFAI